MRRCLIQWCLAFLTASVPFLLPGCSTPAARASDDQPVYCGEKAVVLLGIRTRWNATVSNPAKEFTGMTSFPLEWAVACLDDAAGLRPQKAFMLGGPDASSRQWAAVYLPAGSYYLWAVPTTWLERDVSFPLERAGGFWLQVLPGSAVQYAGTLDYDLRGSKFISEKFYKQFACSVLDERRDAALTAQTRLARFGGTMEVSLMCPYDPAPPHWDSLFPALVLTQAAEPVQSPDWQARAVKRAFGPVCFITEDSSGLGAVGALGIFVTYLPVGLFLSSSWAAEATERWQPCIEAINAQVERLPPDRRLRDLLAEAMGPDAVIVEVAQPAIADAALLASSRHCNSLLLAEIQRILLRECDKNTFCVELAARMRLWDVHTRRYVFDRVLLYSNPGGQFNRQPVSPKPVWVLPPPVPPPYELKLEAVSANHPLEDYCGPAGVELFTRELDLAIRQIIQYADRHVLSR